MVELVALIRYRIHRDGLVDTAIARQQFQNAQQYVGIVGSVKSFEESGVISVLGVFVVWYRLTLDFFQNNVFEIVLEKQKHGHNDIERVDGCGGVVWICYAKIADFDTLLNHQVYIFGIEPGSLFEMKAGLSIDTIFGIDGIFAQQSFVNKRDGPYLRVWIVLVRNVFEDIFDGFGTLAQIG